MVDTISTSAASKRDPKTVGRQTKFGSLKEQTYPEMSVADLHLPSTLIAGDLLRDKSPNNKVTPTGSDWPVYEIWMSSTPSDHWKDFRRTSVRMGFTVLVFTTVSYFVTF